MSGRGHVGGVRLTLPATSANLGPGFDAAGLAMSLTLQVEARAAHGSAPDQIEASGLGAEICGALEGNLILESYREVMRGAGKVAGALSLVVENEIPLGMGCGSSAAARLAGVALANHFGQLGLDDCGDCGRGEPAGGASGQRGGVLVWGIHGFGAAWGWSDGGELCGGFDVAAAAGAAGRKPGD